MGYRQSFSKRSQQDSNNCNIETIPEMSQDEVPQASLEDILSVVWPEPLMDVYVLIHWLMQQEFPLQITTIRVLKKKHQYICYGTKL